MDSVKTDNERELTSTMGNVLSMSSKDEKNDTSDATPTSSTDANTTTTASQIVSDDPISSTSTDIIEQGKSRSTEAGMQNSVEAIQTASEDIKRSSTTDAEADLLEMSISNISNEKITEDVEDLVHDLESLLGESTDSFNIPVRRKEDNRSSEEKDEVRPQTSSDKSDDNTFLESNPEKNAEGNKINEEKVDGSVDSSKTNKIDLATIKENENTESPEGEPDSEKNICSSGIQSRIECETSVEENQVEELLQPVTGENAPDEVQKTIEDPNIAKEENKLEDNEIGDVEIIQHKNEENLFVEGEPKTSDSASKTGDIIADKIQDSSEQMSNKSEHFPVVESSKNSEENNIVIAPIKDNTDEPVIETPTVPEEENICREHKTEEISDTVHIPETVQPGCNVDDAAKLELGDTPTEQSHGSTEQSEYANASERCDSTEEKNVTSKSEARDCEQVDGTVTDVEENKSKTNLNAKSDDNEVENPASSTNQCENNPALQEVIIEENKSSDSEKSEHQLNILESVIEITSDSSGDANIVENDTTPASENTAHELCKGDLQNVTAPELSDEKKDATSEMETAEPNLEANEEISENMPSEPTEILKPEPTEHIKEDVSLDTKDDIKKNIPSEETVIPDIEITEISDPAVEQAEIATEDAITEVVIEEMSSSSPIKEDSSSEEYKDVIIEEYSQEVKSIVTEVIIEELVTSPSNTLESCEGIIEMPNSPSEASENAEDAADNEPELIPSSPLKDESETAEQFIETSAVLETFESPPVEIPANIESVENVQKPEEALKTPDVMPSPNGDLIETSVTEEATKSPVSKEESGNTECLIVNETADIVSESLEVHEEVDNLPEESLKPSNIDESTHDLVSSNVPTKSDKDIAEQEAIPSSTHKTIVENPKQDLVNSELTNACNEDISDLEVTGKSNKKNTEISETECPETTEMAAKSESSIDIEVVESPAENNAIVSKVVEASSPEPSSSTVSVGENAEMSLVVENTSSLSKEVPLCDSPKEVSPAVAINEVDSKDLSEVESSTPAQLESLQIDNAKSEISGVESETQISLPADTPVENEVSKVNEESEHEVTDTPNNTSGKIVEVDNLIESSNSEITESKDAEKATEVEAESEKATEVKAESEKLNSNNYVTSCDEVKIDLETDVVEVNTIDIKVDDITKEPVLEVTSEKVETIIETVHTNQKNEIVHQETTCMIAETVSLAVYNEQTRDVDIDKNVTIDKYKCVISKETSKANENEACMSSENTESNQNLPEAQNSETDKSAHTTEPTKDIEPGNSDNENSPTEPTDKPTKVEAKIVADTTSFPPLNLSEDSDSEDIVPRLILEPEESVFSSKKPVEEAYERTEEIEKIDTVTDSMPEIEDILADQNQSSEAEAIIDMQENLETILAVASLQNVESSEAVSSAESQLSESERREMEAIRKAVESITEAPAVDYDTNVDTVVGELIKDVDIPVEGTIMGTEVFKSDDLPQETEVNFIQDAAVDSEQILESLPQETELNLVQEEVVDSDVNNTPPETEPSLTQEVTESEVVESVSATVEDNTDNAPTELNVIENVEPVESLQELDNTTEVAGKSSPDTSEDKVVTAEATESQEIKYLPDSSDVSASQDDAEQSDSSKEKDYKPRVSKRHKKDNKLEELSINTDVPEKEKHYSPKVTIKPIKVPDEEVSTTSNSDSEIGKGSLKMTITKQSDKMHSILKICEPENSEAASDQDEPIPKLIIKPKMQQVEQQHSPKMSTRSSKQGYSPTSTTQRSGSPRITIKPVVKPEKTESVSPLKIKIGIKPEETSRKHSPKLSIKPVTKPEDEVPKENVQSPIKVTIKPVVKPAEEIEPVHSPRITIKPIPKPEEKEPEVTSPRLNIKPVKKQEEEETEEKDEKEKPNPKVIIKPIVKPQEPDTQSPETDEEVKGRIVLKINKGNLPTPTKESKKREHPPDDDKSEKLAKITVKFSREGGHPHIVQQPEESNKRSLDEPATTEKLKKQKTEVESPISTRSKHKEIVESSIETRAKHKDVVTENPTNETKHKETKSKQKETETSPNESSRSKHKMEPTESPVEGKKVKLRENLPSTPICESTRSKQRQDSVSDTSKPKQKEHGNPGPKPEVSDDPVEEVKVVEPKLDSPIVISEDSVSQDSGSCIIVEDVKDPLADIPVFKITAESVQTLTPKQESTTSTPSTTPSTPTPRKRGRPRKVPIVVREDFKEQEDSAKSDNPKSDTKDEAPQVVESGRPKRSCRGQNVRATLGIKPRKPRGPGRGRGSKRGMGTRGVAMKHEEEPKLSKAKLKLLLQQSLKEAKTETVEKEEDKDQIPKQELALVTETDIKKPAPPEALPHEVPNTIPLTTFQPPAAGTNPGPATTSPKSSNPALSEPSTSDFVPGSAASTSTADSAEIVMVDEETRMSADTNSRAQTPAKQVVPADAVIEESQSSVQSTGTTESGKAASSRPNKAPRLEVQEPEGAVISADQLTEYYWNGNGPFMLQEQVAQFLGIKSFKRKYPGIMRRMLDMQERDFIRESGLASEHMCDLGLTAVNSADILDIMYSDFQDKYEEYCKHQRDRQAKELINKQKALTLAASQEKNKADITEQAVQSAAQWNAVFNKTRREQRKACMDLQTYTVQYPKGKMKQINKGKVGNYPVSLVPGQFTDYFTEFTPTELNNLPINTMCYDPINIIPPEESDDSGSDGSDSDSDSSSSSSGSGSDSSSGVEDCKLCKHSPKKVAVSK